jgi:hypothetical protein
VEQPVAQRGRFAAGQVAVEAEGAVAQAGRFRAADAVLDAGVAAVPDFEVGVLASRAAGLGVVTNAVKRCPSASVNRSCAPGCGRPRRTITRDHAGHLSRSSRPVSSATQAPSRGSPSMS